MSSLEADSPTGVVIAGGMNTDRPFPRRRIWVLVLMAALIAGFTSWLVGEAIHGRLAPPTLVNMAGPKGGFLSGPEVQKLDMAKQFAQTLDTTLVFGSLGAVLGLILGLAGGYARGSSRAAWLAAVAGSIVGGTVGAAVIPVILPTYYRMFDPDTNDLLVGFLFHIIISSAIGAVGGAAFGFGFGDRRCAVRAAIGGLVGAAAGSVVYGIVGAVAFPLDQTSSPISATWGTRLVARLAVTILASVGVAIGALDQSRDRRRGA
jgi:hypothetical protein